jgi:hypothetical protein
MTENRDRSRAVVEGVWNEVIEPEFDKSVR